MKFFDGGSAIFCSHAGHMGRVRMRIDSNEKLKPQRQPQKRVSLLPFHPNRSSILSEREH